MNEYTGKTYDSTERGNIIAHYINHSGQYCECKSPPPTNEHKNETQQKVPRNRNVTGNSFVNFKSVHSFGHFYFLPQKKKQQKDTVPGIFFIFQQNHLFEFCVHSMI
jgi:hypothetical protein